MVGCIIAASVAISVCTVAYIILLIIERLMRDKKKHLLKEKKNEDGRNKE